MVKDFKYIIKRIIIGVGIALLLSFFRGNLFIMAHALTSHTDSIELCATNLACNTQASAPVIQSYANSGLINFTNVSLQQDHTYSMNFYMTMTTPSFVFSSGYPQMYVRQGNGASVRAYPDRNENLFVNRTGTNTYSVTWSFDLDNTGGSFNIAYVQFNFTSNYNSSLYSTTINSVTLDYTDITGGTGSSNDDIINNATSNTQNIINNANNNSQNIINNNNSNTAAIQDTLNENLANCYDAQTVHPTFTNAGLYTSNGVISYDHNSSNSGGYYDVSKYVGKSINIVFSNMDSSHSPRVNYCFTSALATSTRTTCLGGAVRAQNITSASYTALVPQNAKYVYLVGYNNYIDNTWVNKVSLSLPKVCVSKLDDTTDAIDNMNDTLKDETGLSNSELSNLFDDIDDGESNSPVSDLLTMPLTLLNAYVNGMSGTCSAFNLGNLFGTDIIFPCINISTYLGSSLWSLVDSLFCIYMIYNIGMLCVSIYESITSLEDSMQLLYTPQHANSRMAQRGGTYNG